MFLQIKITLVRGKGSLCPLLVPTDQSKSLYLFTINFKKHDKKKHSKKPSAPKSAPNGMTMTVVPNQEMEVIELPAPVQSVTEILLSDIEPSAQLPQAV